MKIINVFAVYGDYGNAGGGSLIGVFDSIERAETSAKGRGSLDCGGDGQVVDRRAIQDGKDFYLLALNCPISMNEELIPDTRYNSESHSIVVTEINDTIEFIKLFRKNTKMSLSRNNLKDLFKFIVIGHYCLVF